MRNHHSAMLVFLGVSFVSSGCQAEEVGNAFNVNSIIISEGDKAFAANDFNNDGYTDLVVAEEAFNRIIVFLNDGAGSLDRANDYPAGDNPTWLTTLDFNGDGHNDLAIANHEANSITLLSGNGDGAFEPSEHSPLPIETAPHSHMIDVADFNADGFPDLVIDSRDRLGIFVLRGMEDGNFSAPGQGIDVGGTPYLGFAIGDVNKDGMPDIITPNRNDIGVLLNRTSGELGFEKLTSIPFRSPFAVAVGDITGDGHIDLIAVSENAEPGVVIFSGNSEGDFAKLRSFSMNAGAKTIAMGDVNGDGIADAVVASWNSDALLVTGDTETLTAVQLSTNGLQTPWGVEFADFNRDGRDEVIIGDATSGRANIYSINIVEE